MEARDGSESPRGGVLMRVDVSGVGIEYEASGEGQPVVLLHGFPDSGRLWRNQVPALAEAGFKVIVPDMRGYGRSDRPPQVAAYTMDLLVGDVLAVLDDAGAKRAHVVGHDWGAGVAWALASVAAGRVDHLVALSVGHPATFLADGFEQYEKSWYVLLFQCRGCRGAVAVRRRLGQLPRVVSPSRRRCGDRRAGGEWVADPRAELLPGEHSTASVRAAGLGVPARAGPDDGRLELGGHRPHRGPDDPLGQNVAGPWRYERIDGPGHWMQLEAPAR